VLNHGLGSLFRFVLVPGQKDKYHLLIKVILILAYFLRSKILVELLNFSFHSHHVRFARRNRIEFPFYQIESFATSINKLVFTFGEKSVRSLV